MPRKSRQRSTIPGRVRDTTADGLYIQISEYNRTTETQGLQHVTMLDFAPPALAPFQQRLLELERELAYPVVERGRLIRRGLNDAALWKTLAKRLRTEGAGDVHWRDIEGMLIECERVLRLREAAGLE